MYASCMLALTIIETRRHHLQLFKKNNFEDDASDHGKIRGKCKIAGDHLQASEILLLLSPWRFHSGVKIYASQNFANKILLPISCADSQSVLIKNWWE